MATLEATPIASWSSEFEAIVKQLQQETILLALPLLGVPGLLLLLNPAALRDSTAGVLMGLSLLALTAGVWALRRWSYPAAAWVLVLGSLAAVLFAVVWGGLAPAIWLLALSAGLATLAVSRVAGVLFAVACTLLLTFAPPGTLPVASPVRTIATLGIWGAVGMICLTLSPLLRAMQWAWGSYRSSQSILEQSRDYHLQLQQALADLTDANLQLTRLNQHAQALRQVAEEERRIKERFVANVSHELRTPLNMIIGFCEMITQAPETYGQDVPPALLADLAVVLRNGHHLLSLIDDVLDLSQIEAKQTALTKERVSLAEIVEAATVAVRPLFTSKKLYLETEIPGDLPPAFCDRTRIREVLLNLLSNAGRFTEQGGVKVRARREGNDLLVSVADTGPGIAEEDKARLFQPFQQLDVTIRRRYGGTGLGLAISKNFVELHGGRMWVESEKGRGTTVFFRLPIDPPVHLEGGALRWLNPYQPYEEHVRRTSFQAPVVRPRLVVVESGNSMHKLLARHLDGVDLAPAADLERAFEELARVPAQALLVNDVRPAEALQRINESAKLPYGVPAIVCAIPGAEQAAGALGAFDYLVKPISREALLGALDRLPHEVRTVLVVDDEPDALQLFGRMLTTGDRDYRVLRADNSRQALEILRQERPDVILLDLVMPEMDGSQFLAVKSQEPAWRDIPVILISARDPLGQPIVSNALAVSCRDGLSAERLLSCIEALTAILSRSGLPGDLGRREAPAD